TNDTTRAATRATDAAVASGTDASRRHRIHIVCSVALLVALISSVWPPALLLAPAIALAFGIALPFTGGARRAAVAAGSALAAAGALGRRDLARARRCVGGGGDRSRVRGRARRGGGARRSPPVPLRLAPGDAHRGGGRTRAGGARILGRHLLGAVRASVR